MKRTITALTCATALVTSLTACGGQATKSSLPLYTPGSSPSSTATSTPTTPPTTVDPVAVPAHASYNYAGLNVVVNAPTTLPIVARPKMKLFSDFVQVVGRTLAHNRLDPKATSLASPELVKYVASMTEEGSVKGVGSVIFTVTKVQAAGSGYALISGCADQRKVVQVRKDGSRYVAASINHYPTFKFRADVNRVKLRLEVSAFTISAGSC